MIKFVYSRPFEKALYRLSGETLTEKDIKVGWEKAEAAQKIWDKHEKEVLPLFEEIYKFEINEESFEAFISLVLPNSFSHPMTFSIKNFDLEDVKFQRIFMYLVIHELAHYFAYTREEEFFNKLSEKIKERDLLGERGANLHYLIQAVEFGIGGEIFGKESANLRREWIIEKRKDDEYGKSAKLLKDHNVPMDKKCLEFIERNILI